jgi:hypothetical protein
MWNVSKHINPNKQIDNDVYTLGAIYKNKEIGSAQLWYAKIHHFLDNDVMLMTNLNVVKGVSVAFDIAQSKEDEKGATEKKQVHRYYNLALNTKVSGVSVKVGAAKTNDRDGVINTSADSKIGKIPGMELRKNIANETGAAALYVKAGYDVNKATNVYVAYNHVAQKIEYGDGNSNEYKVGTKYKVNKKFGVSTYYDIINYSDSGETDQKEARVEFKYSF